MFEYIKGRITANRNTALVVENQGIGYLVRCSLRTSMQLPQGSEVKVFVYEHVSQDRTQLYGFAEQEEREIFQQIIAISGIGPKVALAVLSTMNANELLRAVQLGDETSFTAVPGVGKMTAKRLLLELGKKLQQMEFTNEEHAELTNMTAAFQALEALGFNRTRVEQQVRRLLAETPEISVEDILRGVLRQHGRQ